MLHFANPGAARKLPLFCHILINCGVSRDNFVHRVNNNYFCIIRTCLLLPL